MALEQSNYIAVISDIKIKIQQAQYRAVLSANKELIMLYRHIGKVLIDNSSWGNKFIDNLSKEIQSDFPGIKGYSVRNLKYMKKFTEDFPDEEFVQQVVAQISWRHIIKLMDKGSSYEAQVWYANKTIENGWSSNILAMQIDSQLYERQAISTKTTNFLTKLPEPQSELAIETIKDPYVFEFLSMEEKLLEKDIEKSLVQNITKFLLELGDGFAFIGNQYHLKVADGDFYLDLLFYNYKLHCFFAIEIKTGEFHPEYAGKMNFYLSAIDDLLKTEQDNNSIGLILCRNKNKLIAEYALKDMTKPIGVSEYKVLEEITRKIVGSSNELL